MKPQFTIYRILLQTGHSRLLFVLCIIVVSLYLVQHQHQRQFPKKRDNERREREREIEVDAVEALKSDALNSATTIIKTDGFY